jgi:hypothetical protein
MLQTKNPTESADIINNKKHNAMITNDDIEENNAPNNAETEHVLQGLTTCNHFK